jgi:cytochrome c oxidase subunit II
MPVAVGLLLVLVAVGTVLFHLLSPWWWAPLASNWSIIDLTVDLTFWITGVVFIAIILFMAYCVIRYRYRPDRRAEYEPENAKLEIWLTAVTTVGVVALLTPGLFAWAALINEPEDAVQVEVLGEQWRWSFRLPGEDGILGTTSIQHVSFENPFGIDPNDPRGKDDILVESGDLHLLVDRPVKFLLRSKDVLHNFMVPQFRAKMDMVPGMVTWFWARPTRAGRYEVVCAELCGTAHYNMRGAIVVMENEGEYEAWLRGLPTFGGARATAAADRNDETAVANDESVAGDSRMAVTP